MSSPQWTPPILAYHSIHPDRLDGINVTPKNFYSQMEWLAKHGYQGVSLFTLMQHIRSSPKQSTNLVAITFDDGYRDNLTFAWPILKDLGFNATVFIIAERVGTTVIHNREWLIKYPTVPEAAYYYLSWEEVQTLYNSGIEIGAHTCTHPYLDQIGYASQIYEIQQAKEIIEKRLERPVESFCYPAGHCTPDTIDIVRQAGYLQAVVTPYKRDQIYQGYFTLKRIGIYSTDSFWKFRLKISPLFDVVRSIKHVLEGIKS